MSLVRVAPAQRRVIRIEHMVNPAKLKSLVDQHAAGPSAAQLGMQTGAPAEPMPDYDEDDEDGSEGPKDPAARGQELIESWGDFGEALSDSASELHDQAMDVGPELMLKDIPPDAIKAVGKSVDRMPDDISMGLAKYVGPLPPDDVTALATALCASIGGDTADQPLLTAYLTQAGKYAAEEIDVDEGFNEPDEDDEEEEDGAADGEGAAPPEADPTAAE